MKIQQPVVVLITIALITACGIQTNPVVETEVPDISTDVQENNGPVIELPPTEASFLIEIAEPNCLGDEISPIGQSIANDYESASYDQIMIWFCSGAEFEDILVALETETQTGASTDEMLQMLADGFIWEEIWQLVGLTN